MGGKSSAVARARPLRGLLCAAAVLPRRGPCPCARPAARARAAAAARFALSRSPGRPCCPPAPPLGQPAGFRPRLALAAPVCPPARPCCAAGFLRFAPGALAPRGLGRGAARGPRGVRCGPPLAFVPRPAAARRRSGFGPGGSGRCPPAAAPPFPLRGQRLLRARPAALATASRQRCGSRDALPWRPPAPPAPAGGFRGARGPKGGLRPPPLAGPPARAATWAAVAPLASHCSSARKGLREPVPGPCRCAATGAVQPGLDKRPRRCYHDKARPDRARERSSFAESPW